MGNINRRKFVIQSSKLLAFIPFAGVIGCISGKNSKLSSEDSLKRLIYIIGPWSIEDNLFAKDFARRFLKTAHVDQYLPKSNKLIESLSKFISEKTMDVKEIDLKKIPKEEQEILFALLEHLYNFIEVRFYASKAPPWGHCQGDSLWHTRIPKII